jgi:hypothetical protein
MFSCSSHHNVIVIALFYLLYFYYSPILLLFPFVYSLCYPNCHNIITVHGRVPASVPWYALAR